MNAEAAFSHRTNQAVFIIITSVDCHGSIQLEFKF